MPQTLGAGSYEMQNRAFTSLMNGDVGICLGKSKKRFVTILQNEFYLSTSNTNFPPLTLETYNKFISLINGRNFGRPCQSLANTIL